MDTVEKMIADAQRARAAGAAPPAPVIVNETGDIDTRYFTGAMIRDVIIRMTANTGEYVRSITSPLEDRIDHHVKRLDRLAEHLGLQWEENAPAPPKPRIRARIR